MKIKASYKEKTDIPDGYADLYEEKDGKWILTGVEGIKNVEALEGTLKKERDARKAAEKESAKWKKLGDRDPDDLLKLEDENAELKTRVESGNDEDAIQKRIDAAVAREVNPLKRKLEEVAGERDSALEKSTELSAAMINSKIDKALTTAASSVKVQGSAIADVLMHRGKFEVTEDGKVVTRADIDGLTPGLDAESWLSDSKESRPHWWALSAGGGATGGTGGGNQNGNPFTSRNATEAARLVGKDPGKAEKMAQAAGFPTVRDAMQAMARPKAKNA